MTFRCLILYGLAVAFAFPAQAKPPPRYGVFVFSSLCSEHESGDVDGERLVLVRLPDAMHAWVGYTGEGGLDEAPAEDIELDDKTGRISFRYLANYDPVTNRSNAYVAVTGFIRAEGFDQIGVDGKLHRTPRLHALEKDVPECR